MKNLTKTSSKVTRLKAKTLPLLRGMFITPSFLNNKNRQNNSSVDHEILMELNALEGSGK